MQAGGNGTHLLHTRAGQTSLGLGVWYDGVKTY